MVTIGNRRTWSSGRFAVVDVERSGGQSQDPVELAVVTLDGTGPSASHTWLLKPAQPISARASQVHGISNSDVAHAPRFEDVAPEVQASLTGRYLVAHDAAIDWNILRDRLPGLRPLGVLDTLRLAWKVTPGHRSYRLTHLVDALALRPKLANVTGGPHRALYDATAALLLLQYLADHGPHGPLGLDELVALCRVAGPSPT